MRVFFVYSKLYCIFVYGKDNIQIPIKLYGSKRQVNANTIGAFSI